MDEDVMCDDGGGARVCDESDDDSVSALAVFT